MLRLHQVPGTVILTFEIQSHPGRVQRRHSAAINLYRAKGLLQSTNVINPMQIRT